MREEFKDCTGQFIFSQCAESFPPGWVQRQQSGWTLAVSSPLPVVDLIAADGSLAGWLIGHAVNPEGELVEGQLPFPFDPAASILASEMDSFMGEFGGRYLWVIFTKHYSRIYLDPCGSLGAVYSLQEKTIASTVSLIAGRDADCRHHPPVSAEFPIEGPNMFYPAGLTIDPEIARLLPNHYLDLRDWRSVRYWPPGPVTRIEADKIPDAIQVIVDHFQKFFMAVARRHDLYLNLTAGRDTRMLLACARELCCQITFVTFDYRRCPPTGPGRAPKPHRQDLHLASKLARRMGLRHQILKVEPAAAEVRRDYLFRIGHAGAWGKAQDFYQACLRGLEMNRAWLPGFGVEAGRHYYHLRPEYQGEVTPEALLAVFRIPLANRFRQAMQTWLDGLPEVASDTLLDLLYIEHRLGGWAAPHLYGTAPFAACLLPVSHQCLLRTMMALPVAYRQNQQITQDVIDLAWPELGSLPFQEFTGLRRTFEWIKSRFRQH